MGPATALLADGRILVAGGYEAWFGEANGLASVEIYDPAGKTSALTRDLNVLRGYGAAERVGNDVLVAGGFGASGVSGTSAEIVQVVPASSPLAITTVSLPDGHTGQPYPGAMLAVVGGTSPYAFSLALGSLPSGIVLDSGGQVHAQLDGGGQPVTLSVAGAFQFIVKVTDSLGAEAFRNLQIRVDAPTIDTASIAPGVLNQPYEVALAVTGAAPFVWSLDSSYGWIPDGLSITADGRLTGTIAQTGCWNIGVRLRDASFQTATKVFNLCVNQPLQVNEPAAPFEMEVRQWLDTWMNASGGGQRTWALALQPGDHLPLGLQFTSDGRLYGNLAEAGIFTVTVQATDNSVPPQSDTGQLTFRIGVNDQGQWQIEYPIVPLSIDSAHSVAQA